jgi:hypothetical protein
MNIAEFRRGLIVAVLALGFLAGVFVSPSHAQESAGQYFAREARLHPATMQVDRRVGRQPRQMRRVGAYAASGVAQYASRFLGSSGPSLGLPATLWCADFANMILRATGYRPVPTRSAFAMVRAGPRIPHAAVGALAITGRGRGGHVSIVAAVYPDGSFLSINGNGRGRRVTQNIRGRRLRHAAPRIEDRGPGRPEVPHSPVARGASL